VVVLVWATTRRGASSVGRTLAGHLRIRPHELDVVELDLPEELTGQSLVRALTSWTGIQVESTVLASRGWPLLEERLAGRRPRVVVALDPAAAAAVDSWRRDGKIIAPLVGVTMGLRLEPGWGKTAVDRLAVADQRQGKTALALGLPPECIVPAGVPVCGGFSSVSPDDKRALRRKFKLPEEGRVLLVVTDGLEAELTGVLFQLGLVVDGAGQADPAKACTLMFDVARDEGSADLLRRRAGVYGVEARMFGKVEEAGELWAASDMVLARPHLYVEQRAVALRLPFVHLLPEGVVEEETARVYAEREVGRLVTNVAGLAAEVEMQLASLEDARVRLGQISRRGAAGDVARLIAQVAANADQVLQEIRKAAPGTSTEAPPPAKPGEPLEVIGAPGPASSGAANRETLLADLEAASAEANRQVSEHQAKVDLWNRRAALAADKGARDLEIEARRLADEHRAAMHRALAELGRVAERRKALKAEGQDRVEREFQKLEVEDALSELKRKMGWD